MKRDMDLIRTILLQIENFPYYFSDETGYRFINIKIEGITEAQINYHLALLDDAGLIKRTPKLRDGAPIYSVPPNQIIGLSWAGHEFLDLMKQDTSWNKAKEAMKATGVLAFEVLLKVLIETATKVALGQIQ